MRARGLQDTAPRSDPATLGHLGHPKTAQNVASTTSKSSRDNQCNLDSIGILVSNMMSELGKFKVGQNLLCLKDAFG